MISTAFSGYSREMGRNNIFTDIKKPGIVPPLRFRVRRADSGGR
jgi:hypothetical protein